MFTAAFKHATKHGGVWHAPGVSFEIDEAGADELEKLGAKIVFTEDEDEAEDETEAVTEPEPEPETAATVAEENPAPALAVEQPKLDRKPPVRRTVKKPRAKKPAVKTK